MNWLDRLVASAKALRPDLPVRITVTETTTGHVDVMWGEGRPIGQGKSIDAAGEEASRHAVNALSERLRELEVSREKIAGAVKKLGGG